MTEINELAAALAAAQAEMPAVKMDAKSYHGKYATLGAVIETAKPILKKHGLSIVQFPVSSFENGIGVRTVLLHKSGQIIEDTIFIQAPIADNPAQEAGKIISYLRRYALAAVLGMYSDEDTDANATPLQPPPKVKKATNGDKSIPELLVEAKVADNVPNAANILMKMPNTFRSDASLALSWGRKYRALRDEGHGVTEATELASLGEPANGG